MTYLKQISATDLLWKEAFSNFPLMEKYKEPFKVNIIDNKESIILKAELPGIKKEDISIELDKGILMIKAEKKEETEEKTAAYLRQESNYGVMTRSFSIDNNNPKDITATYIDGILTLTIKKEPLPTFKKIEIL